MSTIYPEIKSILDKCGVSADHVASITIEPMSVIIKRHALKDGKPYSEDNNVVMRPDLLVHIETRDRENREPTKEDRERIIEFLKKWARERKVITKETQHAQPDSIDEVLDYIKGKGSD